MNYDYDLGPVLITDHFHKTAFSQVMLEYLGKLFADQLKTPPANCNRPTSGTRQHLDERQRNILLLSSAEQKL